MVVVNILMMKRSPKREKWRYERSARHRPGCWPGNNLSRSDTMTTCPQKNKKSDALIAHSAIYRIAHSAYHITIYITSYSCIPSIVGSCMTSAALVVVGNSMCGVAMLRSCGALRFLLRKSGFGDSDVSNSNHIKYLWIVAPVLQIGHSERRVVIDKGLVSK